MCGLHRLLFVANAFLFLGSIYFINKNTEDGIVLFALLIICSFGISKRFVKLDPFNISEKEDLKIESASGTFLPIFLGYVFIGLSINTFSALLVIYIILTVFCWRAEIYLYNPIFHLFGYKFYFVTFRQHKLLIMSKKNIKLQERVGFERLGRINDFTYVDIAKNINRENGFLDSKNKK